MYYVDDFKNKLGPQLPKLAKFHRYFIENQPVISQNWCIHLTLEEVYM